MLIFAVCSFFVEIVCRTHILLIDFRNKFNNREIICNEKSTLQVSTKPDITYDILHEFISNTVRKKLIAHEVEAELEAMLQQHANLSLFD